MTFRVDRFDAGGTAGQARALASALAHAAWSVQVLTRRPGDPLPGVRVEPPHARPRGPVIAWDRVWPSDVYRAGGGAHLRWLESLRLMGGWERWRGLPAWHGGELQREREACRAARVVVNSRWVLEDPLLPAERSARVLVRNAVDLGSPPPRRQPAGPGRRVLFLGSGFRRKGLEIAVEAFRAAGSPRDRLVVAGQDRHAERWFRWAATRLGDRLVWVGPTRRPRALYERCDLLISPTWYDAGSNVLLEALASGLPVLSSLRDGNSELSPWPALDPSDGSAWTKTLQARLDEPGDRDQARASAEAWPVERAVQSWVTLLEALDAR